MSTQFLAKKVCWCLEWQVQYFTSGTASVFNLKHSPQKHFNFASLCKTCTYYYTSFCFAQMVSCVQSVAIGISVPCVCLCDENKTCCTVPLAFWPLKWQGVQCETEQEFCAVPWPVPPLLHGQMQALGILATLLIRRQQGLVGTSSCL